MPQAINARLDVSDYVRETLDLSATVSIEQNGRSLVQREVALSAKTAEVAVPLSVSPQAGRLRVVARLLEKKREIGKASKELLVYPPQKNGILKALRVNAAGEHTADISLDIRSLNRHEALDCRWTALGEMLRVTVHSQQEGLSLCLRPRRTPVVSKAASSSADTGRRMVNR
ncbi:MAG: hypothetical protein PHT33_00325 [bacterium]|nr:hypothetical protein [bacterium]